MWKRLEGRCLKHPPDGGEDVGLLHEIYQFAQKELSLLKDKGIKSGHGSVNHALTNEKVSPDGPWNLGGGLAFYCLDTWH